MIQILKMMDYNNSFLATGPGFRGGSTSVKLIFTLIKCEFELDKINKKDINIYITAPGKKEIICLSKIKDNYDGSYTCYYRSPGKRGNYEMHIKINKKPLKGSPFPIFFNNDLSAPNSLGIIKSFKNQFHNENTILKEYENNQHDGQSAYNEFMNESRLAVCIASTQPNSNSKHAFQNAFEKAMTESCRIKITDISPIVKLNSLHDLLNLYGNHEITEFKKEKYLCTAIIKFDTADQANKSLKASGLRIGDRVLRIDKWVDPTGYHNIPNYDGILQNLSSK